MQITMHDTRLKDIEHLTDSQIMRKVIAATKAWLRDHEYERVIFFRYIKGTYYFDNPTQFMLSAQDILESATGLKFQPINHSAAKIVKS